jgi:hypothetical protein
MAVTLLTIDSSCLEIQDICTDSVAKSWRCVSWTKYLANKKSVFCRKCHHNDFAIETRSSGITRQR